MTDRFLRAFDTTFQIEGGAVDDPDDPGGRTCYGVTQMTFNDWLKRTGRPTRDVWTITRDEARQIYREFWDMVRGDDLPDGVAYCAFDGAINSGGAQSVKWLQRAAQVRADGVVGPLTLSAVAAASPVLLIHSMCDQRWEFMKALKAFPRFKNGWDARVKEVRAQAIEWASGMSQSAVAPEVSEIPMAKARGDVSITAAAEALVKSGPALKAGSVFVAGVAGIANSGGPVPWAIAAVLVIGAATWAVWLYKTKMSAEAA